MADGRMIKRRISKSKKIAQLSDKAGFLYFMLYPHADIAGRLEADPPLIKGNVLTYFAWTHQKIQKCLNELHNIGLIILYNHNGEQYLQLTRFTDMQRLDPTRESKTEIPPPPNSRELQSNPENSPLSLSLSKDKLSKERAAPNYIIYGDFVALTPQEYQKLIKGYGKGVIHQYIDRLNNYIGSKGRKYKSHYHTILAWMGKDNIRKLPKKELPKGKPDPVTREKVAKLVHETTGKMP